MFVIVWRHACGGGSIFGMKWLLEHRADNNRVIDTYPLLALKVKLSGRQISLVLCSLMAVMVVRCR